MKPRNILSVAALASALVAIVFAVLQARQHRSATARLQEKLALALELLAEPPVVLSVPAAGHTPSAPAPAPASAPAADIPAAADPAAPPPAAAAPQAEPWLAEFDRAMDREFTRIEEREKSCQDPGELAVLGELKTALMDLDRIWTEMDAGEKSAAERETLANQARNQMMAVVRLAAADRNLRLARVAHALGVEDADALENFITDVDQVFRDTDLDWATLFNRGF
jgi:hypothetical protein